MFAAVFSTVFVGLQVLDMQMLPDTLTITARAAAPQRRVCTLWSRIIQHP